MIETDRVLRPLREAEQAIDRLDTYESPAVLTEALRATWHAVDRSLRTLLRSDASAPDSIRMTAMSPEQMPADAVLQELRRRDLVSLELAGRVHELRQALARAEAGAARATDADNARDLVRCVNEDVHSSARRAMHAQESAVHAEVTTSPTGQGAAAGRASSTAGSGRGERVRPLVLAAAAALVLIAATVAVFLAGGDTAMDRGIAAFEADRHDEAEPHFRAALEQDADNITARLYLARILRTGERYEEAADVLRDAAARAPDDAAVRRELGYLFLDLNSPRPAAEQFRRAVEIDAADRLNWLGLVDALNRTGDSAAAAEWLSRAPAAAR
ncbi:MAG TPA: tetratricopeptide repeat protein [Longimicrobiales bacterium]|nr:tetratricopeptide repeat protein [Longimicrobiales bacterium]